MWDIFSLDHTLMDTDKQGYVQKRMIKMEISVGKKPTLKMLTRTKDVYSRKGDMIT